MSPDLAAGDEIYTARVRFPKCAEKNVEWKIFYRGAFECLGQGNRTRLGQRRRLRHGGRGDGAALAAGARHRALHRDRTSRSPWCSACTWARPTRSPVGRHRRRHGRRGPARLRRAAAGRRLDERRQRGLRRGGRGHGLDGGGDLPRFHPDLTCTTSTGSTAPSSASAWTTAGWRSTTSTTRRRCRMRPALALWDYCSSPVGVPTGPGLGRHGLRRPAAGLPEPDEPAHHDPLRAAARRRREAGRLRRHRPPGQHAA